MKKLNKIVFVSVIFLCSSITIVAAYAGNKGKHSQPLNWVLVMEEQPYWDILYEKQLPNGYIQYYIQEGTVHEAYGEASYGPAIGTVSVKVLLHVRFYQTYAAGRATGKITIELNDGCQNCGADEYTGRFTGKTKMYVEDNVERQEINGRFWGKGDGCRISGKLDDFVRMPNYVRMIGKIRC